MSGESSSSGRPAFQNKTVVVFTRSRALATPLVLSDCAFVVQGGRLFLVGTNLPARPATQDWLEGVRHRIAWDAVEEYLLFDSPEDYYSRVQLQAPPQANAALALGLAAASIPLFEGPQGEEGHPVEPSEIYIDSETPLEIGSTVLAFSQGRWWRAEVVDLEGKDQVRIHFPGWDPKWDETVMRDQLQVDLSGSLEADEVIDAEEPLE